MSTEIILPKIGFSMNEGTVAEWLVADGAQVVEGQPLYSLESDKSVEEIPAPASGTLKILKAAGAVQTSRDVNCILLMLIGDQSGQSKPSPRCSTSRLCSVCIFRSSAGFSGPRRASRMTEKLQANCWSVIINSVCRYLSSNSSKSTWDR